jgi:hypothetical protein
MQRTLPIGPTFIPPLPCSAISRESLRHLVRTITFVTLRELFGAGRMSGVQPCRSAKGSAPDAIMANPCRGAALFLRDVFLHARHLYQCEYYYAGTNGDVCFDPEFPSTVDDQL